jgi:voltage-gated potassium channel
MDASKLLIFGCNTLSLEVASKLDARGLDLSFVTRDADCAERARARGFEVAEVDYTNDDELTGLGIGSGVKVIFTLFEEDSSNVFLTISARDLDPEIKVVSISQSEDSMHKLKAAGVSKVIDPYEISGRKVYDLIKRPLIAEAMDKVVYGERSLNMAEIRVPGGSFLDGVRLGELELSSRYNLVLLGVVDRELGDEFIFSTSGVDHKLDQDDVLVVIGPDAEVERLRKDSSVI